MDGKEPPSQFDIYDRAYFWLAFLLVSSPWVYLIFLMLTTDQIVTNGD